MFNLSSEGYIDAQIFAWLPDNLSLGFFDLSAGLKFLLIVIEIWLKVSTSTF